MTLDRNVVDAFRNDGATILRGVFSEFWIEELRAGIDVNMATPGPHTKNYTKEGEPGFFFGDYCNWHRIPHYKSFFFESTKMGMFLLLACSVKSRISPLSTYPLS